MSAFFWLALASSSARPEPKEIVHSSDGNVTVWNYDSGLGAGSPDWITTLRWVDTRGAHDAIFDEETGRLGWVEAIGVFETRTGPVYLLISEDHRSDTESAALLTAVRARDGNLHEAVGFFPPCVPGSNETRSAIAWEFRRPAGRDAPRPLDIRLHEPSEQVGVIVDGEAQFVFELRGDGLVAVGLHGPVLERFVAGQESWSG